MVDESVRKERAAQRRAGAAALALWLGVQLAALALAAGEVRLSDDYVRPAERGALQVMIAVQFAAAAMLSPILTRRLGTAIMAAACSWIMMRLAAYMAAVDPWGLPPVMTLLTMWIACLWLWQRWLSGRRGSMWVAAAATAFCIGGAGLAYLGAEFGGEWPSAILMRRGAFGPIWVALESVGKPPTTLPGRVMVAGMAVIPLAAAMWIFIARISRQFFHRSSTVGR